MKGLAGKRVIVTRPSQQANELSTLLEQKKAIPIEIPMIEIEPVDFVVPKVNDYLLGIFTSVNGVRFFFDRLKSKLPETLQIAAVGEKTAEALRDQGVTDILVPKEPSAAEELISVILERYPSLSGKKVLFPRAERGREVLPATLREKGAELDLIAVYRTVPVKEPASKLNDLLQRRGADWLTFASSSAVDGFSDLLQGQKIPEGIQIGSIGRITSNTLKERGFPVHAEPKVATVEAMVEAMNNLD